ncbi:MAG: DNA gyrase subunit A [Anaerolineae bacterium]|nr:DNA gyrase subunit A [Anaerolineae bacterium]
MEIGTVRQVNIESEMQDAYLSYAMSVIVARALPDARDGLKPVQRRILYAMQDLGLRPEASYKKSARIVGEVLGKYHPHGDAAVYDAMARMAQDFSLRYMLVDGQGNFGSIDGDSPAAMRYTEARMAAPAASMLTDIDKNTVDFVPNFDETLMEPAVLPAVVPNLLVNGASGIAVGMSTSIPPHNLGEVCDALVYLLDNWSKQDDVGVEDLMQFVKGPDFPTGGLVYRQRDEHDDALAHAYGTGRGRVTVRARVHVEEMSRSRHRLVVTELPYQTNKTNLIERIAELVRDGRIEGITDLRDESDRQGLRLVIETTRTVEPGEVLLELFKRTPLESTFSIILLALVDGQPRLLTLKKALVVYLEHRQEIITRRSRYDLERAKERAHILEGLRTALDNLDEVIAIIRRSRTTETARTNLRSRFKLSEVQANAILDMPLKRLAALERRKIEDEYKEKLKLIRYLTALLKSPSKIRGVIREELLAVKAQYADPRRTEVVEAGAAVVLTTDDLIPDVPVWVGGTRGGLVARVPDVDGNPPSIRSKVEDPPLALISASTRDALYIFAADGTAVAYPIHQLPEGEAWNGVGAHVADLTPLTRRKAVVAMVALPTGTSGYLLLGTRDGMVKRVALADLPGVGTEAFTVMGVAEGDALGWVMVTGGDDEVLMVTRAGQAIRFKEEEIRPMGLPAGGVMGVKLGEKGDGVAGVALVRSRSDLFIVTEDGRAKRTPLVDYPTQGRYGKGVIAMRLAGTGGGVAGAAVVQSRDPLVLVTEKGATKTVRASSAPRMGRATQGDEVVALKKGDRVIGVCVPVARPAPEERAQGDS